MTTDDHDKATAEAADNQKKDADALAKRRDDRGEFDAQAEIDRVRAGVMATPQPGDDPDAKQRLAKHLVAQGVDLPDGLSTDPVTDDDRKAYVDKISADTDHTVDPDADDDDSKADTKKDAANKRATAGVSRTATPPQRSATPTQKAAE